MPQQNTFENSAPYVWGPCVGPSKAALARLLDAAPRPIAPPGEAWLV